MGDVARRLCQLCRCSPGQFPGAQLVSADQAVQQQIGAGREYWASTKTDGERALLYFDADRAYAVDRLMRVTELPCEPQRPICEGTVLDCELVGPLGKATYVVFDVLVFAGRSVQHLGFRERLAHAERHPSGWRDLRAGFDVITKPFFSVGDTLGMYWFNAYCEAQQAIDGVVLIAADAPYHPGRHWGFCKWKPAHKQTVDFIVQDPRLDTARLGDCDVEVRLQPAAAHPGVWECSRAAAGTVWVPLKHRDDKDKSNDKTSYLRTLDALGQNAISLGGIFARGCLPWTALDAAVAALLTAYASAEAQSPKDTCLELEFRLGKLAGPANRWRVGVTRAQHQHLQGVLERSLPCDRQECTDTLVGGKRARVLSDGSREDICKTPLLTHTLSLGAHAVRVCLSSETATSPEAEPKGAVANKSAKVVDKVTHTYHVKQFYIVLAHRQDIRPSGPSSSYQVEVEWRKATPPKDRLEAVRAITSGLMKVMEVIRHLDAAR